MKLSKSDRKNALKHTYVKIIFTTHELKTFCIEAYSVLGLCLHVICKLLSSPSPPQGYCGTPLCTWPLMRSSIPLL